jgi:predicted RND superfamily exporter protein
MKTLPNKNRKIDMRRKILTVLFSIIERHPLHFILGGLVFGALFFLAFRTIDLKSNYIDLLPQDSKQVEQMRALTDKLGGVGQFSVVIESKSKDVPTMQRLADALNDSISRLPDIEYIQYKFPRDFLAKHFYLFMDTDDLETVYNRLNEKVEYEIWKDVPFFIDLEEEEETPVEFNIDDIIEKYQKRQGAEIDSGSDYMISADQTVTALFLKPDFMPTEVDKTGNLIARIDTIKEELSSTYDSGDITISYAGTYTLGYDQQKAIVSDISLTSIIALVIIFLAILLFIRKLDLSVFLLVSLTIGVLSAFGIAWLRFGYINLITGFLLAILTGLGVNYGIHLLFRYREEYKTGNELALKHAFISTGRASITGAATTAISFATLIFSRFLGFSEFGFLASLGIMITLASTYILVAAMISITARFRKPAALTSPEKSRNARKYLLEPQKWKKALYISAICLAVATVALSFFLPNLSFEYNSRKLEVKGQKSIETTDMIQQKFNISTDPAIFYTYDREQEKDFYNTVNKTMSSDDSLIGNIISVSAVVADQDEQKKRVAWIKKIREEIDSLPEGAFDNEQKKRVEQFRTMTSAIKTISEDDLPAELQRRFFASDREGKRLYISQIFPRKVLFNAMEMEQYVDEIDPVNGQKGSYFPTGMHIIYVFLINTVLNESRIFLSIVLIIIYLLLLMDFQNLKDASIAMIPILVGTLWLIQIMSALGIKFNFMNIVVLPSVLGTGVDNGVHIFHRYRESKNIFTALSKTGIANFGMSLTVALGWSALFFAHYEGLKTMAFVGVTGILLTFLASITIMPVAVLLLDRKKIESN